MPSPCGYGKEDLAAEHRAPQQGKQSLRAGLEGAGSQGCANILSPPIPPFSVLALGLHM